MNSFHSKFMICKARTLSDNCWKIFGYSQIPNWISIILNYVLLFPKVKITFLVLAVPIENWSLPLITPSRFVLLGMLSEKSDQSMTYFYDLWLLVWQCLPVRLYCSLGLNMYFPILPILGAQWEDAYGNNEIWIKVITF